MISQTETIIWGIMKKVYMDQKMPNLFLESRKSQCPFFGHFYGFYDFSTFWPQIVPLTGTLSQGFTNWTFDLFVSDYNRPLSQPFSVWPQWSLFLGTVPIGTICQILVPILKFWSLFWWFYSSWDKNVQSPFLWFKAGDKPIDHFLINIELSWLFFSQVPFSC